MGGSAKQRPDLDSHNSRWLSLQVHRRNGPRIYRNSTIEAPKKSCRPRTSAARRAVALRAIDAVTPARRQLAASNSCRKLKTISTFGFSYLTLSYPCYIISSMLDHIVLCHGIETFGSNGASDFEPGVS